MPLYASYTIESLSQKRAYQTLLNSGSRPSHDLEKGIILEFLMSTSAVQCFPISSWLGRYMWITRRNTNNKLWSWNAYCSVRSVQARKAASLTSHQQKQMEKELVELLRGGVSESKGLFFQFASKHLCFHPRKHGSRYLGRRHFHGRKFSTRTVESLGSYSNQLVNQFAPAPPPP